MRLGCPITNVCYHLGLDQFRLGLIVRPGPKVGLVSKSIQPTRQR